jgi:glycosyltransferase involved in cell wall biosynthesis
LRLAVVSPFIDRRHGTERVVLEQLKRLARDYQCEIHLYAQRVADLEVVHPSERRDETKGVIFWHRVSSIPGPHLIQYLWWFAANTLHRLWDRSIRGLRPDLIYSPGINLRNADVIAVHIVFQAFFQRVRHQLTFARERPARWPLLLHRRLYYQLIMFLERRIYSRKSVKLAVVAQVVSDQISEFFGRTDAVVIRNGVDVERFSKEICGERRSAARERFRLAPGDFALLLIGNDWKKKGLEALLVAIAASKDLPVKLLVVGEDDRSGFEQQARSLCVFERLQFHSPSDDVVQFYSAADAYVAPSLEDAYGLPIVEAMASGLPVVVSVRAGASEIIRDGVDGMLLQDPEDASEIAACVRRIASDPEFRNQLGRSAATAVQEQTWDRNAEAVWKLLTGLSVRGHASRV